MADSSHSCALCGKPATIACLSCNQTPYYDLSTKLCEESTFYCTSECQILDQDPHADLCHRLQQRRALHRAASLLQRLFYALREQTWMYVVVKIKQDGNLRIMQAKRAIVLDGLTNCPFPGAKVLSAEDKAGALTTLSSEEAVAYLQAFGERLLSGIKSSHEEITCRIDNKKIQWTFETKPGTVMIAPDGHELVKINLANGEQYVLDLSGAQYGFSDPLTTWSTYVKERDCKVKSYWKPGHQRETLKVFGYGRLHRRYHSLSQLARAMFPQMLVWETSSMLVTQLLLESPAIYTEQSETLYAACESRMRAKFESFHKLSYNK